MVKIVIFFNPKPGMALDAFRRHWRERHAEIIARLPGLRRYVQSHVLASADGSAPPAYAAVAESSFDDTEAMKALAKTPQYAEVLADEPNFIDRAGMGSVITEAPSREDAPPAGGIKRIDFLKARPGVPIAKLRAWCADTFAPGFAALPTVRRHALHLARESIYASGRTPAFDVVSLSWYESEAAARAVALTPAYERLRAGLDAFVVREASPAMLAEEHVILA